MAVSIPPRVSIALAIVSFGVALLPALGIVLRSDVTGRIIFALVWFLVGLAWLGQLIHVRRSGSGKAQG